LQVIGKLIDGDEIRSFCPFYLRLKKVQFSLINKNRQGKAIIVFSS
jgi:hypothetical protein